MNYKSIPTSSGIYQIRSLNNGKIYIGSAVNFRNRARKHFNLLKLNKHHSIYLQRSYNMYKNENFVFEILENVEKTRLFEREQYYIDNLNPEYNMAPTAGSSLGRKATEETKARISKKRKELYTREKNPFYGRSWKDPELQEGLKIMKEKLKIALSGEKNPFYGKTHSPEVLEKISKANRGVSKPQIAKANLGNERGAKIYIVICPDGKILEVFNLTKFCRERNLFSSSAFTSIKKNRPYNGYIFKLKTEELSTIRKLPDESSNLQIYPLS